MIRASVIIKECRRCGTSFYDGKNKVTLEPNMEVTIIKAKLSSCNHCPYDVNPRDPGFKRV